MNTPYHTTKTTAATAAVLAATTILSACQDRSEPLAPSGATAPSAVIVQPGPGPGCSPYCTNAKSILFGSNRDGNSEIYTMNPDGTGVVRLTNNPAIDGEAVYSPDHTKIAFISYRTGKSEMFVMNANGSGVMQLTFHNAQVNGPAWSPDGTRIAFSSSKVAPYGIFVMNADGTNEKLITNNQDASPNWSPDGSKIVFVSSRLGPYQHVFTMNADGTNQQQLTPAPTRGPVVYSTKQEMQPRWSPDGKRIVYVQYDFNDCKIWMINPDRTGNTLVVDSPGRELFPTWSPDGSRIAFSSTRDQTGLGILHTIYTASPDGSAQKRISPLTSSNDPLTWGR